MSAKPFLMKGKVFSEHKHKLVYPVVAEVKYDEIRLHVRCCTEPGSPGIQFLSYDGKPLHNLDHWAAAFAAFMVAEGITDLDMGVLVNGNFNDSYRWCRSSSGIPQEKLDKKTGKVAPALAIEMVQFYLFDVPQYVTEYGARGVTLEYDAKVLVRYGVPTRRPLWNLAWTPDELDALFDQRREEGYEGLMVKSMSHKYQPGKRIDGWLKMKPESEADGRIVKVNQAFSISGEPLDRAGSVDVVMEDGSTASPSGLPHALARLMWAIPDRYIGQWCTVEYMERDRQGGYRHPSFTRLRESK